MPDVLDAEANKQRSSRGKRWKMGGKWGENGWGKSGSEAMVNKNKQDMGGLRYVRVGVFVRCCLCLC